MPTAFDINTSIQRCLVKAIALHGLGLYIYAGEDLPEGADQQPPQPAAEMVNAEQIARIKSLLAETGQTLQRLLAFLHVDALEQIPASEFLAGGATARAFEAESGVIVRESDYFSVRLWESRDLVEAIYRNYDRLPAEVQAELPLKKVWMLVVEESGE